MQMVAVGKSRRETVCVTGLTVEFQVRKRETNGQNKGGQTYTVDKTKEKNRLGLQKCIRPTRPLLAGKEEEKRPVNVSARAYPDGRMCDFLVRMQDTH